MFAVNVWHYTAIAADINVNVLVALSVVCEFDLDVSLYEMHSKKFGAGLQSKTTK